MVITVDAYLPGLTVSSLAAGLLCVALCVYCNNLNHHWIVDCVSHFTYLSPVASSLQDCPLHSAKGGEEGCMPEPVLKHK